MAGTGTQHGEDPAEWGRALLGAPPGAADGPDDRAAGARDARSSADRRDESSVRGAAARAGQPLGRLMQICFVVPDLERALAPFSSTFGAGPWFVTAQAAASTSRSLPAARYRGQPAPIGADIALAYSGEMMYELACPQPHVDSVWSDRVRTHGHGLHHLGFGVTDFDATLDALRQAGRDEVFSATTSRGTRVVMVGGDGPLGVLEEYIELTSSAVAFYAGMQAQAAAWDGEHLRAGAAPAGHPGRPPTRAPDLRPTTGSSSHG